MSIQHNYPTTIEAIQFSQDDHGYYATVAAKCGDHGIAMIYLYGDDSEACARWPQDTYWTKESALFQHRIESELKPSEFLTLLEKNNGLENNAPYLEEHQTVHADQWIAIEHCHRCHSEMYQGGCPTCELEFARKYNY